MAETLYDIVTRSPEETIAFGRKLAGDLHPPSVVLLQGDFGSGKTTLTKGVAAGLGAAREEDVTSPSFALVHEYRPHQDDFHEGFQDLAGRGATVYHVDLYRVEGEREAESLGLDELFSPSSTVMIEWGDKLSALPPGPLVRIWLEVTGEDARHIIVERADE